MMFCSEQFCYAMSFVPRLVVSLFLFIEHYTSRLVQLPFHVFHNSYLVSAVKMYLYFVGVLICLKKNCEQNCSYCNVIL